MSETIQSSITQIESEAIKRGARNSVFSHSLFLLLINLVIGAISYVLAWLLRMNVELPLTQDLLPTERWDSVSHWWFVLLVSQAFCLYVFGLFDDLRRLRLRELFSRLSLAVLSQVVSISFLFYMANEIYPRSVILLFGLLNGIGLTLWYSFVRSQLKTALRRVLVVGRKGKEVSSFAKEIANSAEVSGIILAGIACNKEDEATRDFSGIPFLGDLTEIQEIVIRNQIDEVIFVSEETWRDRLLNSLGQIQSERPVAYAILPSVYEMAIGRLQHINIHDTPLIEVRENPNEPVERIMKRGFDLILSTLILILTAPLFVLVAIATFIGSPGPVFYLQERIGYQGRAFKLIKFRTMIPDAERETGEKLADKNDPRVTRVGAFFRRFRIDEIPQFINVLKGDMSFVGPRPERPLFVRNFLRTLPGYSERHKVKPGITGLAQVRGYYDTSVENKLKYDLAYIYNQSFSLDLMILLETIKTVLIRPGS